MIKSDNLMKEMTAEIKRLNQEVKGLRADLRAVNVSVASNSNGTARLLRKIDAMGIKVRA